MRWSRVVADRYYALLILFFVALAVAAHLLSLGWLMVVSWVLAVLVAAGGVWLVSFQRVSVPRWVFFLALGVLVALRVIPFLSSSLPFSENFAVQKFVMESYYRGDVDTWVQLGYDPGLYTVTSGLLWLGFSSEEILKYLYVFFELIAGALVFVYARRVFGRPAATWSVFFFAVSLLHLRVFLDFHIDAVLGSVLCLLCLFFMVAEEYDWYHLPLLASALLLAFVHRPSFVAFWFLYALYAAWRVAFLPKVRWLNLAKDGLLLLALVIGAVALYWSRFPVVIEPLLRFGDWNFVEWSLSWRSLSFALL
ncbi:MAG: hypothetical protein ABIH41_02250, partial [Nanoarchaeota archaeon]